MNDSLPPGQWRPLFDAIGCEFGYRPLANRIGMDHTRLRRLLRGGGTSAAAIQQVADALGKLCPWKHEKSRPPRLGDGRLGPLGAVSSGDVRVFRWRRQAS